MRRRWRERGRPRAASAVGWRWSPTSTLARAEDARRHPNHAPRGRDACVIRDRPCLTPTTAGRTVRAIPGRPGTERAAVRLEGVRKVFGDVEAVAGIDLEIHEGEFFSMLGPSGSGKTTTLRMIAGFGLPTAGRILLDGEGV